MKSEILKMAFGFLLIVMIGAIALSIAHGHVEERTSFGLLSILGTLSTLVGGFTQWAFNSGSKKDTDKNNE